MLTERNYQNNFHTGKERKERNIAANVSRENEKLVFSPRERRRTIAALIAVGMIFIVFVIAMAFTSTLAYKNNAIADSNSQIEADIQSIKVKIQEAMNIGMIEETARGKIGMIYPEGSQVVQVKNDNSIKNFAELLREEAYN